MIKLLIMNWGNKLFLVFVVFAGMITYMVSQCIQTPVDLVDKEYYRDELAYQQVVDGARRANALSSNVQMRQDEDSICLQWPEEMKHTVLKGSILFYCVSDAAKDRRLPLKVDITGRQAINARTFLPGRYIVKIQWNEGKDEYFTEQPVTIQ